jgi:hypothetical protein
MGKQRAASLGEPRLRRDCFVAALLAMTNLNMSLKDQIKEELKEAMKAKNEVVLSVLRMLNSAIKNKELEKRGKLAKEGTEEKLEEMSQLNDEEIVSAI